MTIEIIKLLHLFESVYCLVCEAEARHRYCFSGAGGVNFGRVFWFSSVSQEL